MSNINGTSGDDIVYLGTTLTPSNIYDARGGNDYVVGSAGANLILGGDGDDIIDGRGGSDVIFGGAGNDVVFGGNGSDLLFGDAGADVVRGGAGVDIVSGGAGNDTFVFHAGDVSSTSLLPDMVLDFRGAGNTTGAEQDVLELHGFSAGSTLDFVGNVGDATHQLYKINDAVDSSASGYVLINTDSAAHLNANDVKFVAKPTEAVIIDFEDIDASIDPSIAAGYHGFNFSAGGSQLVAIDVDQFQNSGYHTAIDGVTGASNPFAVDPVVVTRSDGSDFVFNSVNIAAASDASQVVTLEGYSDGVKVGSITTTITYGHALEVDANWGLIDTLVIDRISTTGDYSPTDQTNGSQFVLDNFSFVVSGDYLHG
uniref:Hemolysin-type calcium-binding region n=1 Tax=Caulobacter sp. (strain K31) TaxID=366602 RepID=B0T7R1_CAUSK